MGLLPESDLVVGGCPVVVALCRGLPIKRSRAEALTHHLLSILPLSLPSYSVLNNSLPTDSFSRTRTPTPQNAQRAQNPARTNTSSTVGEIGGRVDRLALLQNTLQNGATPTMIAGFAMIIAQMQDQADYPEVRLTITSSIGPLERSATFNDCAWHVYDLTHNLIDPRSHVVFGEPTRPPMDQERSLCISQAAMQPPTVTPLPPTVPPPVLTPPMP